MNPLTFSFVLIISIVGILFAGYKEWLKFRAKQHPVGVPPELEEELHSLQDRLGQVERERDVLRSRVENLETIVTSEAWDRLDESAALDAAESSSAPALDPPSSGATASADQAEALAQRIRSEPR